MYSIINKSYHNKRLICYSTFNNEKCNYGIGCIYAHNYEEQYIDTDKKQLYKIIFDNDLSSYQSEDFYKSLFFLTINCDKCFEHKCSGGYNCKNGAPTNFLRICKNDLLTGECLNKIKEIENDDILLNKLKITKKKYLGCLNGHHLTNSNLIPYYTFLSNNNNCEKNRIETIKYIEQNENSSTDDEINDWFQKKI